MKKNIIFSIIISLAMNTICLLVNFICVSLFGYLPLGIELVGGEFTESIGFGVSLQTIYSFGTIEEASTTTIVSFHFMSFFISFVLLFVVLFVIKTIVQKIIKNRA